MGPDDKICEGGFAQLPPHQPAYEWKLIKSLLITSALRADIR
jgi:hypothetical protein